MASRSLMALTAGTAGAIILGYCLYFDQKRRSDPEYKRKIRERRQREQDNDESEAISNATGQSAMEISFYNEMKVGEQLISSGNIADGVTHFANAIMMCAQPLPLFQTFQESLPDFVFMPLLMKLTELQASRSSSKDNLTSTPDTV